MKTSFNDLINSDQPLLIDFYADWCGPCQMMPPILTKVKNELGDQVRIIKIDVDKNKAISDQYEIRSIPTLMIFKQGELVWRHSGVPSVQVLKDAVVQQLTPSEN